VSFLRAQGHPDAEHYVLCTLWVEATIAQQRINGQMATEAVLMHQVVQTVLGDESAFNRLQATLKGLGNGE
jgi:hypothetical protein